MVRLARINLKKRKEKLIHIKLRKEQYNNEVNSKLKVIASNVSVKGYTLPLTLLPQQVKNKSVYSIWEFS